MVVRRVLAAAFVFMSLASFEVGESVVRATTFVSMPFPDLIKGAPTIVHGIIGSSQPEWVRGANGSKRIFTFYAFQLEETFKGNVKGGSIQIRELGGEIDGVGMRISGSAEFSPGEDVVVFLGAENDDGSYDVRGLSSGKLNLERWPDGRECLSGIALGQGGRKCSWDVASLREVVRDQGDTPAAPVARVSPASVAPRSSSRPSSLASSPAPGLQPSAQNEVGADARGQLWIVVLALGLAGLLALFLIKPRR